jgi:hypothetical protein
MKNGKFDLNVGQELRYEKLNGTKFLPLISLVVPAEPVLGAKLPNVTSARRSIPRRQQNGLVSGLSTLGDGLSRGFPNLHPPLKANVRAVHKTGSLPPATTSLPIPIILCY